PDAALALRLGARGLLFLAVLRRLLDRRGLGLVTRRQLDEAARREALLDLVERLLAEVAHAQELLVRRLQQLADLGDAVPLQRVERALRQVEVLDRHVRDLRREARAVAALGLRDRGLRARETREQRELLHEDVRSLRDRLVRRRRAVGPHLEDEAVVVRDLTDA